MTDKNSGIKQKYDVHLVGRASSDAKMEMAGERPVTKFSMWVSSGKNRKTQEYQKPFYFNVKVFGDQAKHIKKGQDVELFGYFSRSEYEKNGEQKTWDEVIVRTDEKGAPQINFSGMDYAGPKHVSDEAVAQGRGKTIQQKVQETEITDEDCPFN